MKNRRRRLAQEVEELERKYEFCHSTLAEVVATMIVNFQRGNIVVRDDPSAVTFKRLLGKWKLYVDDLKCRENRDVDPG